MKEFFKRTNFKDQSLERLGIIDGVISEYAQQGYDLSLRQLYYQLVARGYIENSQRSYKRLINLVGNGRLAGIIDWSAIRDRSRSTDKNAHWSSPASVLQAVADGFAIDKWETQPWHVEVMVEKDALSGVLGPVCSNLDVRFTANKGYSSLSMMYEIGKRLDDMIGENKDVLIIYLGDHDPSGMDMTRDIADRLSMFADSYIEVNRVALNMDQIEELDPPKDPAKLSDSRAMRYIQLYGYNSWELDAVEPRALAELVQTAVLQVRDNDLWAEAVEKESAMIDDLQQMARDYGSE